LVQQLLAMPPRQAIEQLIEAMQKGGGAPEVIQTLQAALRLPEEEQRKLLQQLLAPQGPM
jgi:hypothetical protein